MFHLLTRYFEQFVLSKLLGLSFFSLTETHGRMVLPLSFLLFLGSVHSCVSLTTVQTSVELVTWMAL